MKGLQITKKEKHDKWNKELIESRIALEKEHYKRFVPAKEGLDYRKKASTSHDMQLSDVPLGTSVVHPDVKMQTLYRKLRSPMRKCTNFVKQNNYKPFRPGYSKYVNMAEHQVCWHCGNVEHLCPVCPKRMHMRGDVPSNGYPSVQENTGMTSTQNVHKKAAPNRPIKMV